MSGAGVNSVVRDGLGDVEMERVGGVRYGDGFGIGLA